MAMSPEEILTEAMQELRAHELGNGQTIACSCGNCREDQIRCATRLAYRMVEMARTVIRYKTKENPRDGI